MKPEILFVDDDLNLILGLQRILHSMRSTWNLHFTTSGEGALEILKTARFDVVVTDMRMPKMDGAELLGRVRSEYPHIVRIIFSGDSDQDMIFRSLKNSHQFLSKPCSADALKKVITRALELRKHVNNPFLRKLIGGITQLPSLPRHYQELLNEIQREDTSIRRIGEMVSQDMAMSGRILQLVNSAFFGLSRRIVDPAEGVVFLGLNVLKSLLLLHNVFNAAEEKGKNHAFFSYLWEHSQMVSALAKEILVLERGDSKMTDVARMAGILHDIGSLLIFEAPNYDSLVESIPIDKEHDRTAAECANYSASHAEIGAYLLGIWGLPDDIVEAVAYHHRPPKDFSPEEFLVPAAIYFAEAFCGSEDFQAILDREFIRSVGLETNIPAWIGAGMKIRKKVANP